MHGVCFLPDLLDGEDLLTETLGFSPKSLLIHLLDSHLLLSLLVVEPGS